MKNKGFQHWWKLDNAAKIFPSSTSRHNSKVFRFICELQEPIKPQLLQDALDRTLERFPIYQSVMKRGLFWYYLEDSSLPALVRPEDTPPCFPIYPSIRRGLLFRVLYFRRRIILEVYHALTDGAGALQFLRTLVYEYLLACYPDAFGQPYPTLHLDASDWQKQADSFQKYYEKPAQTPLPLQIPKTAYRLKGSRLPKNRLAVLEGRFSLPEALTCARARGITLTELMTAVQIRAIHERMRLRDMKKPVVISIPVNLRSYFPSKSARNFFATIQVTYDFSRQEDSLEAIAAHVKQIFESNLTKEYLRKRMNALCALEHSIPLRVVPLPLKDIILRVANMLSMRGTTSSFSNVGKVSMPVEMEPYIRQFGVLSCAGVLQACACSFGDCYVVSFAGPFREHEVERTFFRELAQLGLKIVLTTNFPAEGDVN